MLGNSAGRRRGLGLALGAILVVLPILGACPKMVPQDQKTGTDGKPKGAKKVALENNEAKAKGIVTWPGGDRVDWKQIDLPEGKVGTLNFKLSWTPPRPGLDLSFEVFDQYYWPVGAAKPKKHSKRTVKKIEPILHAKGPYYVMIYASERGDAGKYTLSVDFEEDKVIEEFDLSKVVIPDPPKLPTVPPPPVPCDPKAIDPKNPACAGVCPDPPDPKNPACANVCPPQPDINIVACQRTMPCPNPPDRRAKSCMDQWKANPPAPWPACNFSARDPGNPNCDVKLKVTGKVIDVSVQGADVVITVNRGSTQGVAQGWNGKIVVNGKPVPGGDFVVVRVTKTSAVGKVKLQADTVKSANVELIEP